MDSGREEVTINPNVATWLVILIHLALGFMTTGLAVDEGFAEDKVTFDHERWRWALGVIGVFLTYRAARALVRSINRATVTYDSAERRSARLRGLLMILIAAGFFVASDDGELAQRSIQFMSWADPVYRVAAFLLVLTGLAQFGRPRGKTQPRETSDVFPDGMPRG